jgi:hypothetical protein
MSVAETAQPALRVVAADEGSGFRVQGLRARG